MIKKSGRRGLSGKKTEMEKLQKEIDALKREKKIHEAQNKMLETFISLAHSSHEELMLNATMKNALDILVELSGAEQGSLFLLDKKGVVTDSLLTQNMIEGRKRSRLIGKIIDSGLAGWVKDHLIPGLVMDTETDERWLTLPDQSYHVRSALSVPIFRHHSLFGIITLMHALPSQFNPATANSVQSAADQMALVIENAKLYGRLEQYNILLETANESIEKYSKALNDELESGKQIQKKFLPRLIPDVKNFEIAAYFHSALQLSGDFYDLFELSVSHLGFFVGDVSGKGAGSALFMALTRSVLRIFSGSLHSGDRMENLPENVLKAVSRTNEYLSKEHCEDGMFVSLFYCVVDRRTGKASYINAGHEPVLVIRGNKIKKTLHATGPVLGPISDAVYEIETLTLEKGDLMFCFTDGVTDARSATQGFYTRHRVEQLIEKGFGESSEALLEMIKSDLFTFTGKSPQSDDITMLAVKWCEQE